MPKAKIGKRGVRIEHDEEEPMMMGGKMHMEMEGKKKKKRKK